MTQRSPILTREDILSLTHRPRKSESTCDAWPAPQPLSGSLPPVTPFSERLLPEAFRPFINDAVDRMQVRSEFVAIPLIVALAAAVGRRAQIQPKRVDAGWQVVPNLWGAIVAPPGFLKSPAMRLGIQPLTLIERGWRLEYESEMVEHGKRTEAYDIRTAAWKESAKSAAKQGRDLPARPDDVLNEPPERRLIVNDATAEALHEILAGNPAGVLQSRDELGGWLANLERQGREAERAFFLEAWNGDSSFTMDRIGRGSVRTEACCISLLGGIQPGRLRAYLADALHDGPTNDGLMQRFQLLVWPDVSGSWTYTDRAPDQDALQTLTAVFERLVRLDPGNPVRFGFDDAAQGLFIEWLTALEYQLRDDTEHQAVTSHLSKYRSLMPSLAVLFELADRVAMGSSDGFEGSHLGTFQNFVTLRHAQQAAAWCVFLESHARRVYSCVVSPTIQATRDLGAKVKAGKLGVRFRLRQIYFKGWSGLSSPDQTRQAVAVLEELGWVRRVSGDETLGRPPEEFDVNPKLIRVSPESEEARQ